ncbi:phage/plasmid primase, P4 family [Natronococcus sp. A-GB1]|uniref:DNA primase family protein n=1 Tax=Natronococcus sp. A-GB1 TaxID=3037648 RepID=UPI00241F6F88|nr:DNA primase family protein [Natronococcus sp. A-GB1]MDG5760485.1 phage/plasmid primase, P4 family [Natronococcus sp. A-GB1]
MSGEDTIDADAHGSDDAVDLTPGDGDGEDAPEEFAERFPGHDDSGEEEWASELMDSLDDETDDESDTSDGEEEEEEEEEEGLMSDEDREQLGAVGDDYEHEPVDVDLRYNIDFSVKAELDTAAYNVSESTTRLKTASYRPEDGDVLSIQARILSADRVDTKESAVGGQAALRILIADGGAATRIQIPGQIGVEPGEDFEIGDEVVVTDLEVTEKKGDRFPALEWQATSSIEVVSKPSVPLSDKITITHGIEQAARMYLNTDRAWAREELVKTILEEMHVLAPFGEDEVWLYIDDEDRSDHGLWVPNGDERLRSRLSEWLPADAKTGGEKGKIVNELVDRARCEREEMAAGVPDDADLKWMVGVENGVIDLRNGEVHDHDAKWRLRSKIRTEYKPDEYDGLGGGLAEFLDDVTKTDDDRELCLAMAAHSLMRNHSIKASFPILGPSNSGKSKWQGGVRKMLGGENVRSVNFEKFAAGKGFESGKVRGAHAVIDDDASGNEIQDLSFFRKVTGGEDVSINQKYEKLEDYAPYATVSLATNEPQRLKDPKSGVKSRIYPIIMPHRYTDEDDEHRDKIPVRELEEQIYADEEIEALLVAAVEKAQEMFETGKPGCDRTEKERWSLYQQWADSVQRFFNECVVSSPDHTAPKSAVYEVYKRWCKDEGVDALGPSKFWKVAKRSATVYFEAGGTWFDSNTRGVDHIQIGPDGLDYAPDAVLDGLDANGTAKSSLDTVTPIGEISWFRGPSFTTIEGEVVKASEEIALIEDDDQAVELINVFDAGTSLEAGDRIRVERAKIRGKEKRLECYPDYTEIQILTTRPEDEDQSRLDDSDDGDDHDDTGDDPDDDGDDGGEDLVNGPDAGIDVETVDNIIRSMAREDLSRARLAGHVYGQLASRVDKTTVRARIDKLAARGDIIVADPIKPDDEEEPEEGVSES